MRRCPAGVQRSLLPCAAAASAGLCLTMAVPLSMMPGSENGPACSRCHAAAMRTDCALVPSNVSPSWGTAAYALSRAGIACMLSAVAACKTPLDVNVAALQHGAAATHMTALAPVSAAGLTATLPPAAGGDCAFSPKQAGWAARSNDFSRKPKPHRRVTAPTARQQARLAA